MKMTFEDIVGDRSDSCRAAFEKVAYAAERHSEQTPAHDQLRTILRSGECHDLVELINFQALKIKELEIELAHAVDPQTVDNESQDEINNEGESGEE